LQKLQCRLKNESKGKKVMMNLKNHPLLIGIDVGTTSVKAGLFDDAGNQLATFSERYPTMRGANGEATQDPADWIKLVEKALHAVSSDVAQGAVAAVGLTSQVNTHVFVDENLKPLLPAFTWQDTRCAGVAAELDAQVSTEEKIKRWGVPLPIDASHVLARMEFVKRFHPDVWAKTAHVLAPKDYCIAKLTGEIVTDPMTAFGVVDRDLQLIEPLVALAAGAKQRLPQIAGFTKPAGKIQAGLPCSSVPMVVGAMDAWAGFLGAGAARDGDAVYLSGTSEILGLVSQTKVPTPGVIAFPECEGLVIHAGPTQSGAASLDWASRLFNRPVNELSAMVAALDPQTQTPVFLPHLDGERAPIWDATSRGAFAGATANMGASEFTLAVLEGVAYSVRWLLESLEHSAALKPFAFLHAGGGARADIWCQIRADVLGVPIKRLKNLDAGVAGAAMLAGLGVGFFGSLAEAAQNFVQADRAFQPRPDLKVRHNAGFERYKALYAQLKPFNAR
jgi:xylulokinase